jgi:acyl-CoA thioesterase II
MGSLDADTRLAGSDGRYTATLSPDWRIWGPNGGYVAAIALRAAGAASRFARPVSFACHFLGVGAFAPADVRVERLRSGRNAESLRVVLAQDERAFLDAQVWTAAANDGMEHDFAPMPEVPPPAALASFETLETEEERGGPRHAFWDNLEGRPTDWVPRSQWRPRAPRVCCWYRFRPDAHFGEPFLDAARALILIDTLSWPAACQAHEMDNPWMAPSLDVAVRFHRAPPYSEWLLLEARADVATQGLIGFHNRVWDEDGRCLASGGGQLLCRPKPG